METTAYFHKLFVKAGGYGLEFDTNADPIHDSNGLGRVHREGAPLAICMSCPCPQNPYYTVDIEEPFALSLCSAVKENGEWMLGSDEANRYEVLNRLTDDRGAFADLLCSFASERKVKESYRVSGDGVSIAISSEGELGFVLPAFDFDGEKYTEISVDEHSLSVEYDGWLCRYTTDGTIVDLNRIAANRNGHYKTFLAVGEQEIHVKIEIIKQ